MHERRAIKGDISDVHVAIIGVGKRECQRFAATAGNLAEIEQRAVCAKPARQHTAMRTENRAICPVAASPERCACKA